MTAVVIDYGAGNLASVVKALRAAGADASIARSPADLGDGDGIIIPGVGHFGATRGIDASMRDALRSSSAPLLGICLGMQVLFEGSDEAADVPGLGLLGGRVTRMAGLDANGGALKIPHVGWNTLDVSRESALMRGTDPGAAVYFTHGYAAPVTHDTVAVTEHGCPFASIVERGRISGMQFHPEKSGRIGLTLLKNWVAQCSASA